MPLLIGAAVAGGVALLGGGGGAAAGAGKSKYKAQNFGQTGYYNPNQYQYGGTPGLGIQLGTQYGQTGQQYASNADMAFRQQQWDRAQAGQARNLSLQARGQQQEAANLMLDRARGRNLISTRVADANRRNLASQMQSGAASARGPAALANAQSDSMAAGAQGLAGINENQTTAAIAEQQAAEQGAFGAATGMREGDTGLRGGDITSGNQALTASDQQARMGLGYEDLRNKVYGGMNELGVEQQKTLAGSQQQQQQLDSATQAANAKQDWEYINTLVGGAKGAAQAGVKAAADGGPIEGKKPRLIGEHGPEIFVPKEDGYVVPNPADQPSVYYGPDGRPYKFSPQGPVPLTEKPREMGGFRRDTAVDQKVVQDKYYAGLAAQADKLMAQMRQQKMAGPSVARDEGEVDEASPGWLTDYMATQEIPDTRLAQRAYGGETGAGNPYIVGENGPERFVPASQMGGKTELGLDGRPFQMTGGGPLAITPRPEESRFFHLDRPGGPPYGPTSMSLDERGGWNGMPGREDGGPVEGPDDEGEEPINESKLSPLAKAELARGRADYAQTQLAPPEGYVAPDIKGSLPAPMPPPVVSRPGGTVTMPAGPLAVNRADPKVAEIARANAEAEQTRREMHQLSGPTIRTLYAPGPPIQTATGVGLAGTYLGNKAALAAQEQKAAELQGKPGPLDALEAKLAMLKAKLVGKKK